MDETHRKLATACFNDCWTLIEKPDRSAAEDEQMLLLAYAAAWHWSQRPDRTPTSTSVSYWQLSRVHALLGHHDMARLFGAKCLSLSQESQLPPFYVGYACEALARAESGAGNALPATASLAQAEACLREIADPEERAILEADLKTIRDQLGDMADR